MSLRVLAGSLARTDVSCPSGLPDLAKKKALARALASIIGREAARRAEQDPHARRPPRPCGLTVHPGRGCPNACLYCYIGDLMGTGPREPTPTGLSGPELAYALTCNPYFVPGRMGTFLAMGAICDPFYPSLAGETLDIMGAVARYLGNPTQFSTKMAIGPELAKRLPRRLPISPLVTIVTLEKARELEPRAPPPEERLRTIRALREAGLRPMLFLRPIIPGITDREADEILSEAKRAGAYGVVVGVLRVSKAILARLAKLGLDKPIRERLRGRRLPEHGLVAVPCPDIKEEVLAIAREKGLLAFKAACCANAFCAGVPCADLCWLRGFCTSCPNRCPEKVPEVDEDEVAEALRTAYGLRAREIRVEPNGLTVLLERGMASKRVLRAARKALEVATRRPTVLRPA